MGKVYHQAGDVMSAIHSVYAGIGNAEYAKGKTNIFMYRCGADITLPKEQLLSEANIKMTIFRMLDKNAEALFWQKLKEEEKE